MLDNLHDQVESKADNKLNAYRDDDDIFDKMSKNAIFTNSMSK